MGQSPNRTTFDPWAPDPWNAPGPVPMRELSDEERGELRAVAKAARAELYGSPEPETETADPESLIGKYADPWELDQLRCRIEELEAANKRLEDRLALVMDHGLAAGEKLAELQKAVLELRERGTKDTPPAPAWAVIAELMEEISREFHDQAALRISTKRACNLYRSSRLSLEDFLQCMYAARHLTKSNASAIRLLAESEKGAVWTRKNAVPYFFAVLESTLQERRS